MSKDFKQLVTDRKNWANHIVGAIRTAFSGVNIEITTGRFTHTADGFDVHIKGGQRHEIESWFEKENICFGHVTNGDYTIVYPDKLSGLSEADMRDKGKNLEREKTGLVRYLGNQNLKLKNGAARVGSYTTNKYESIKRTTTIELYATNDGNASQIFSHVKKYYSKNSAVEILKTDKTIKIKFHKEFFDGKKAGIKEMHCDSAQNITETNGDQKIIEQIVLEDGAQTLKALEVLKINVFTAFKETLTKELHEILTDPSIRILNVHSETVEATSEKIECTRQFTKDDIRNKIIGQLIKKMCS